MAESAESLQLKVEWGNIRSTRDALLKSTDWMSLGDSPTLTDAWKTYRAELRTLPVDQSSKSKYEDITWPTKPE